jgi:uncharacterized membrane protein YgdD (TMEM256/DUF423 family)
MNLIRFKNFLLLGVVLCAVAIVLGAFGAHALKEVLSEKSQQSFEVGVRYQLFTGLGVLLMVLLKVVFAFEKKLDLTLMLVGILLFSGSIYLLALDELWGFGLKSFLWPLTPLGGLLLIISWTLFFLEILKKKDLGKEC